MKYNKPKYELAETAYSNADLLLSLGVLKSKGILPDTPYKIIFNDKKANFTYEDKNGKHFITVSSRNGDDHMRVLLHEIGHAKYTDFKVIDSRKATSKTIKYCFDLLNLLEDIRIEKKLIEEYNVNFTYSDNIYLYLPKSKSIRRLLFSMKHLRLSPEEIKDILLDETKEECRTKLYIPNVTNKDSIDLESLENIMISDNKEVTLAVLGEDNTSVTTEKIPYNSFNLKFYFNEERYKENLDLALELYEIAYTAKSTEELLNRLEEIVDNISSGNTIPKLSNEELFSNELYAFNEEAEKLIKPMNNNSCNNGNNNDLIIEGINEEELDNVEVNGKTIKEHIEEDDNSSNVTLNEEGEGEGDEEGSGKGESEDEEGVYLEDPKDNDDYSEDSDETCNSKYRSAGYGNSNESKAIDLDDPEAVYLIAKAIENKLKKEQVERKNSPIPSKRINIRGIVTKNFNAFYKVNKKRKRREDLNVMLDTSGSMSGGPANYALVLIKAFNLLAKKGYITGNFITFNSMEEYTKIFTFPLEEEALEGIAFNNAEGLGNAIAKYANLLKGKKCFIVTDANLTDDKDVVENLEKYKIEEYGLYVNPYDSAERYMRQYFRRYLSVHSLNELIAEISKLIKNEGR